MLERLKGKIDTPIHEIRCFSKSEPVQSENRLKEITIKTVGKPDPSQLEKINLNQTRDESTA
ncbi:hypothetical protein M3Y97_00491600 [Aphelenchoides bicaudatus]|nr:hypothetical protein M3Y97_00491600 [Aphelenchoides bicaudatus]